MRTENSHNRRMNNRDSTLYDKCIHPVNLMPLLSEKNCSFFKRTDQRLFSNILLMQITFIWILQTFMQFKYEFYRKFIKKAYK